MGRDHSCEGCGRGGFNDPDGECVCDQGQKVERFRLHALAMNGYQLVPDPSGDYIRFSDHQAKVAELEDERDELRAAFAHLEAVGKLVPESRFDAALAERDAALQRERELRGALAQIERNDGTDPYLYGETRLSDGLKPPSGKRWNAPREIARSALNSTQPEPEEENDGDA